MNTLIWIFNWIVYSSVTGSVLAVIIIFIKLILKNRLGVRWHYCIWIIVMLRLIIPYAPQSVLSVFNLFNIKNDISLYSTNSPVNDAGVALPLPKAQRNHISTVPYNVDSVKRISAKSIQNSNTITLDYKTTACIIWLFGVVIIGVYRISKTLCFLQKVKSQQRCTNEDILNLVTHAKCIMGLNTGITTLYTDLIKTPAIFGVIRPKLLLPVWIENQLTQDELKYIILHEIAHVKRKDVIISCIAAILNIIHWFNPILWYSFYRMRLDRELACDAFALTYVESSEFKRYGQTIIKLLEFFSKHSHIYGMAGILEGKSEIKRRMIMILSFKKGSYKWSILSVVILVVFGYILLTNAKASPMGNFKAEQSHIDASGPLKDNDDEKRILPSNTNTVTVKDINGNHFNGKLMLVSDPKKIVVGYSLKNSMPDKTTSEIAKQAGAIGAVNAGAFKRQTLDASDSIPVGFIVNNGKIVYNETGKNNLKQDTVGFSETGKLFIGGFTLSELEDNKVKEAVCFGLPIISNGASEIKNDDGAWGVTSRTALGQKEDGTVLLLVINGGHKETPGATLKDVSDILLKEGAVNAALLDGGSSSTMYYNGDIINKPGNIRGGERIIPAAFLVLP